MRKKPMSGHNHGGMKRYNGGRNNNHNNHNRPRKNYGALREKYLNQARDALSSGDRVLAENYFQHADHYYRMMAEENERRAQWQQANQPAESTQEVQSDNADENASYEDDVPAAGSLPAFLTQPQAKANGEGAAQAPVRADWDE